MYREVPSDSNLNTKIISILSIESLREKVKIQNIVTYHTVTLHQTLCVLLLVFYKKKYLCETGFTYNLARTCRC